MNKQDLVEYILLEGEESSTTTIYKNLGNACLEMDYASHDIYLNFEGKKFKLTQEILDYYE